MAGTEKGVVACVLGHLLRSVYIKSYSLEAEKIRQGCVTVPV